MGIKFYALIFLIILKLSHIFGLTWQYQADTDKKKLPADDNFLRKKLWRFAVCFLTSIPASLHAWTVKKYNFYDKILL